MSGQEIDTISTEEFYGTTGLSKCRQVFVERPGHNSQAMARMSIYDIFSDGILGKSTEESTEEYDTDVRSDEATIGTDRPMGSFSHISTNEPQQLASDSQISTERKDYLELSANIQFKIDYIDDRYSFADTKRKRRFQEYCFRPNFSNFTGLKQYFESLKLSFQFRGRRALNVWDSEVAFNRMEHLSEGLDILLDILEPQNHKELVRSEYEIQQQKRVLLEVMEKRVQDAGFHLNLVGYLCSSNVFDAILDVCAEAGHAHWRALVKSFKEEKQNAQTIGIMASFEFKRRQQATQDLVERLVKMNGCLVEILDILHINDFVRFKNHPVETLPAHHFYEAQAGTKLPYRVNMEWKSDVDIGAKPKFANISDALAHTEKRYAQTVLPRAPERRVDVLIKAFPEIVNLEDVKPITSTKTWFELAKEYYAKHKHPTKQASSDSEWEFVSPPTRPNSPSLESVATDLSTGQEDAPRICGYEGRSVSPDDDREVDLLCDDSEDEDSVKNLAARRYLFHTY